MFNTETFQVSRDVSEEEAEELLEMVQEDVPEMRNVSLEEMTEGVHEARKDFWDEQLDMRVTG